MEEKRSNAIAALVAILLLAPCLYLGSYYALVQRRIISADVGARYRVGGEVARVLFEPMHRLDRWLRTEYWDEEEPYLLHSSLMVVPLGKSNRSA
jgi:hypothetical protein